MKYLENAIQLLADKLAIQEVTARYCRAVDEEDLEAYLSLWTEDGVSEADWGSATGHTQLRQRFGTFRNKRHAVVNSVISVEENRAVQQCYLLVFERAEAPTLVATARYEDELRREEDGWKFVRRKLTVDPSWRPMSRP